MTTILSVLILVSPIVFTIYAIKAYKLYQIYFKNATLGRHYYLFRELII